MNDAELEHLSNERLAIQLTAILSGVSVGLLLMLWARVIDSDDRGFLLVLCAVGGALFLALTVSSCVLYRRDQRRIQQSVARRRQL